MTVDGALYTRITTDAGIAALVGTNVYPVRAPDNFATYPYVTLFRVTNESLEALAQGAGIAKAEYQIDVWGNTFASIEDLRERLRLRLQGFRGTVGGVVIQGITEWRDSTSYEPDIQIYRSMITATVWYTEAVAYSY